MLINALKALMNTLCAYTKKQTLQISFAYTLYEVIGLL